ncbi:SH3 domain-containing protein [Muricauda sp. CAU 1633]|uniref:SH3 domain-containing protein n=1 Tax=Allomuricauda sp. CAU 1633 TaxID=2816036 RepID=UPI001A8DDCD4|nr:SH3 domain-containing protein [Muricauda sp. CAU 1633]MBO0321326.1 SH3 domain-containing protein [Muricauda sp. CAU 1633]
MKTVKGSILFSFVLLLIFSCGTKSEKKNQSSENSSISKSEVSENPELSHEGTSAICLWPKVGLRDKPGRKNTKYLTTIYFGESVEYLNETEQTEDDKEYLKIRLSDGSEGWAYEHLFALGGELAIIDKETELYKRPDIMTFEGKKLEPMDMVVIFENEENEGWHEVTSMKRDDNGWIQGDIDAIKDDIDVKLGILYWRAMEEPIEKKFELLENILANPNFKKSKLIDHVNKALYDNEEGGEAFYIEELDSFENLSSNKLGIKADMANVRSEPNTKGNVLFQLEKGDICHIIGQGASLEKVGDRTDRWYKINFSGEEGWVFGYYTTKRRN